MNADPVTGAACIAPEDDGTRLDAALARLLPLLLSQTLPQPHQSPDSPPRSPVLLPPDAGVRARRRLWLTHAVLLDGRPAKPGTQVRAGQRVEVRPLHALRGTMPGTSPNGGPDTGPDSPQDIAPNFSPGSAPDGDAAGNADVAPRVLTEAHGLVALYKPGGLHSAAIAGSAAPCVEALLPALLRLPDLPGLEGTTGFPRLLNRLDGPTSGILLAARTPQAADLFHAAENSGQATKTYLALVHGVLAQAVTVRRALDTANRAITRVLPQDTPDLLRHTEVTPLGVMNIEARAEGSPDVDDTARHGTAMSVAPGAPCTLIRCVIRKGARHQIRAHLAALGHPIAGDARYGTPDGADAPLPQDAPQFARPLPAATLFLHHARIELPDFHATCPPPWLHLLPPELQEAARTAYRPDS